MFFLGSKVPKDDMVLGTLTTQDLLIGKKYWDGIIVANLKYDGSKEVSKSHPTFQHSINVRCEYYICWHDWNILTGKVYVTKFWAPVMYYNSAESLFTSNLW